MYIEELWRTSAMLSSVLHEIDELGVPVGKCELLDRIYQTLKSLERECDKLIEETENA